MSKIFFNEKDLERLKKLSDSELYILTEELSRKVHETKANIVIIMSSEETITQLIGLAETALKEIARRDELTPITSNGKYSTDGLTYDTPECRLWLSNHKNSTDISRDFLREFSFYEALSQ